MLQSMMTERIPDESLLPNPGGSVPLDDDPCYNHNVTREVRMNSGGLEEVEAALMSSGGFVRAETSVYGGSKHLTADLHPAYRVQFSGDRGIWYLRAELRDNSWILQLTVWTHIGFMCKEIPVAADFLRDCHELLLQQGLDLAPVALGETFVGEDRPVIQGKVTSLLDS